MRLWCLKETGVKGLFPSLKDALEFIVRDDAILGFWKVFLFSCVRSRVSDQTSAVPFDTDLALPPRTAPMLDRCCLGHCRVNRNSLQKQQLQGLPSPSLSIGNITALGATVISCPSRSSNLASPFQISLMYTDLFFVALINNFKILTIFIQHEHRRSSY